LEYLSLSLSLTTTQEMSVTDEITATEKKVSATRNTFLFRSL